MTATAKTSICFHCGESCGAGITFEGKQFCCTGCQTVYSLLHQHQLDNYYCLNEKPGVRALPTNTNKFAFLDDADIVKKLVSFQDKNQTQVTFYLPQIHCSSCLWLLENLYQLNDAIIVSRVNFLDKKLSVSFRQSSISLRGLAELLTHVGYEPHISLQDTEVDQQVKNSSSAALKLGITGFCFANIMLISFPEYLGLSFGQDAVLATFFRYLNLALAVPVLCFGAREFYVNAYHSFQQKQLNIDAPIALAITITFLRSIFEIMEHSGAGYLDSMSGIIFFMLIGRTLQNRTSGSLRFNRDHRSYFPISVTVLANGKKTAKKMQDLEKDDVLLLHHQEIVPVDGILSKGKATIDYSFVTGESMDTSLNIGEIIYAGGKVISGNIELLALKSFSQSDFTRMWNNPIFREGASQKSSFVTVIGKYFSFFILLTSLLGFAYWQWHNPEQAWNVLTAVLIVACPCSLLLSSSFVYGFVMQMMAGKGLFVKNTDTIERLATINHVVFDKTGTLTEANDLDVRYEGEFLNAHEEGIVISLLAQSMHPLSKAVVNSHLFITKIPIEHFKETLGMGMEAWVDNRYFKVGSASFVQLKAFDQEHPEGIFIDIDHHVVGRYIIKGKLKESTIDLVKSLGRYKTSLLSGDNDKAKSRMQAIFPKDSQLLFQQSPLQKLEFVQQLQAHGDKVLMVGDGLNDAGALKQSHVGIAIVKQAFSFSPSCDGVLDVQHIGLLPAFIKTAKAAKRTIVMLFIYSIIYNVIGLYFALSAQLQPMVAAILMPASSMSIILFAYGGIHFFGKKYFPKS